MVGVDKTDENGGSWGFEKRPGLLAKPLGLSRLDVPREPVRGLESLWSGRRLSSIDCWFPMLLVVQQSWRGQAAWVEDDGSILLCGYCPFHAAKENDPGSKVGVTQLHVYEGCRWAAPALDAELCSAWDCARFLNQMGRRVDMGARAAGDPSRFSQKNTLRRRERILQRAKRVGVGVSGVLGINMCRPIRSRSCHSLDWEPGKTWQGRMNSLKQVVEGRNKVR